jgi:plasmid stabilization system protein ParE
MTRRVVIRPEARRDFMGLVGHIAQNSRRAARRLEVAAAATLASLASRQGAGCPYSTAAIPDLRYWHVKGFRRHFIFFRATDQAVEIVRILHSAGYRVDPRQFVRVS